MTPLSAPTFPFDGDIDEVRIWNVARTSTEIQSNMNNELLGSETGLIGYFNFNHGVDCGNNTGVTTLTDSSPTLNDATLYNFDLTGIGTTPCLSNWNGDINTDVTPLLFTKNNIVIYPNPTTGSINIDLGETLTNLTATLTNSLGQVVLSKKHESIDFISVDINTPAGIYFLQLQTENGAVITRKILKE